jgi:hypothetical protein
VNPTPDFDHVKISIQEFDSLLTLKMEDLIGSLKVHEPVINESKSVHESLQALQAQTFKKNG